MDVTVVVSLLVNTTTVVLGKLYLAVWLGGTDDLVSMDLVSLGIMRVVIVLVPVVDNMIGALDIPVERMCIATTPLMC